MLRTAAPGSISINISLGITSSVWKIIGAQHTEFRTFPSHPTHKFDSISQGWCNKDSKNYLSLSHLSSVFTNFSNIFTSCNHQYHLSSCCSVVIRHGPSYWYLSSIAPRSMIYHYALSIIVFFYFLFFIFTYHFLRFSFLRSFSPNHRLQCKFLRTQYFVVG